MKEGTTGKCFHVRMPDRQHVPGVGLSLHLDLDSKNMRGNMAPPLFKGALLLMKERQLLCRRLLTNRSQARSGSIETCSTPSRKTNQCGIDSD